MTIVSGTTLFARILTTVSLRPRYSLRLAATQTKNKNMLFSRAPLVPSRIPSYDRITPRRFAAQTPRRLAVQLLLLMKFLYKIIRLSNIITHNYSLGYRHFIVIIFIHRQRYDCFFLIKPTFKSENKSTKPRINDTNICVAFLIIHITYMKTTYSCE